MEFVLMVVSILLIGVVLLQSGKAEGAGQALMGGGSSLFENRKERGVELFISRLTLMLGISFFVLSLVLSIV